MRTKAFQSYRDKLADPRFYTPIKSQLSNAAHNANAARTGGPIMVDQFMIPGDMNEFKWLNENMSTVTQLYDAQRKMAAESQKRLFSAKREREKRLKSENAASAKVRSRKASMFTMTDLMGAE